MQRGFECACVGILALATLAGCGSSGHPFTTPTAPGGAPVAGLPKMAVQGKPSRGGHRIPPPTSSPGPLDVTRPHHHHRSGLPRLKGLGATRTAFDAGHSSGTAPGTVSYAGVLTTRGRVMGFSATFNFSPPADRTTALSLMQGEL